MVHRHLLSSYRVSLMLSSHESLILQGRDIAIIMAVKSSFSGTDKTSETKTNCWQLLIHKKTLP